MYIVHVVAVDPQASEISCRQRLQARRIDVLPFIPRHAMPGRSNAEGSDRI
jgi:hypothetical protein